MGKVLEAVSDTSILGKAFGGGKEGFISAVFDPANFRDKITGKSEKEAGKAKEQAALDAAGIIRQGTEEAREDIFRLFPQAQQSLQQGFQGAVDVFGQALPQQAQAFQGGNVAAQQALLAGLPQFQNAILGGQVDLSGLQPFQAQLPDFSFAQQQLPQQQPLQPQQPQQAQQPSQLTGIGPSFFNNFNRIV